MSLPTGEPDHIKNDVDRAIGYAKNEAKKRYDSDSARAQRIAAISEAKLPSKDQLGEVLTDMDFIFFNNMIFDAAELVDIDLVNDLRNSAGRKANGRATWSPATVSEAGFFKIEIDTRRRKVLSECLGTILHEMCHIFIFAYGCVEGCEGLNCSTESGHGYHFQQLLRAIRESFESVLGINCTGNDFGRAMGLVSDFRSTGRLPEIRFLFTMFRTEEEIVDVVLRLQFHTEHQWIGMRSRGDIWPCAVSEESWDVHERNLVEVFEKTNKLFELRALLRLTGSVRLSGAVGVLWRAWKKKGN